MAEPYIKVTGWHDGSWSAVGCTDLVFSPDDGGWYAQESDFTHSKTRTTKRIYSSRAALIKALRNGTAKWERWS